MPYRVHNRLSVFGTRNVSTEVVESWTWSINFGNPLGSVRAASPTDNDGIAAKLSAFWEGRPANLTSRKTYMAGFKWNQIGPDGRYTGSATPNTYYFAGDGIPGLNDVPAVPPQTALVVSLRTDFRGRSARGRFYLPIDKVSLGVDWSIPTEPALILPQVVSLIDGLNTQFGQGPGGAGELVVASSKDANYPVTELWVGNYLDTQRRRRRSFEESYTKAQI